MPRILEVAGHLSKPDRNFCQMQVGGLLEQLFVFLGTDRSFEDVSRFTVVSKTLRRVLLNVRKK